MHRHCSLQPKHGSQLPMAGIVQIRRGHPHQFLHITAGLVSGIAARHRATATQEHLRWNATYMPPTISSSFTHGPSVLHATLCCFAAIRVPQCRFIHVRFDGQQCRLFVAQFLQLRPMCPNHHVLALSAFVIPYQLSWPCFWICVQIWRIDIKCRGYWES